MTAKNPYRAGSLQEPGAYIEREADQRLRKELGDNRRYPFIFAPPDSGKSSLLRRTLLGLDPGQHCGVFVDLARLRLNDYTLFMGELLSAIAHEGDFDSREIDADCPEDTFLAWMGTFPQRLIVLLDGVESLARTSFSEQFFGKLKFLLNVRAENDEFVRLQMILASSIPMGRLVPTHLQTPYTTEIMLPPLSPPHVDALAWHLNATGAEIDPHVGAAVYRHTSGVPFLCQQLLAVLWDEATATKAPLTVALVNQLVERGIDRATQNEHLAELFRVITSSPTMLDTFLRLRRGQTVDPQRMQELVSTGLCDYDQPYRCSIYERVYGPGGPLDLTRAASQRGTAEPQQEALSEPPRPPRPPEPTPPPPLPSGTQRAQLLPEPPRPTPSAPAVPVVPPVPPVAAAAPPKPAEAPEPAPGEFSADDEQTAVDDLESRISLQEETPKAEGARSPTDEVRALLEEQLFLPAELDSFCISYFPPIARQFKPTMSRADKTNLLLAEAEPAAIVDRLKQWEASLERRQQVVSAVVTTSSPVVAPAATEAARTEAARTDAPKGEPAPSEPRTTSPQAATGPSPAPAGPPPPPAAALSGPPPIPETAAAGEPSPGASPGFREPTAVLTVGVGLVLANRYFLTSEVGHGAVATVWNAYDRIKDEQVALKLLHGPAAENPQLVQRFWHSAQQQASLSHPAIVGVLNKPREESGIHYVVMEYVPAGNLRSWVINSKLTRTQLLRLMQRLGSALQYAHERKVLHRNVKPTNILFDTTGHARLVDFSLQWPADATAQAQSRSDRVIYMAPEEQLGDSDGDPRSDVYSLGMCALFALHGKELPSLVMQERAAFIEQLEVPPALKAVVKRAVAMNAADRFASAAEFCRALEVDAPALPGISVRTSDIRPPERRASAEDIRPMKLEPSLRISAPPIPGPPPAPPPAPSPPPAAARPAPPPPPMVAPPPPMVAPPPSMVASPAVAPPAVAPPLGVPAMPPAASSPPPAPPPAPPPPRTLSRISEEIPPVPGRSPTSAAQYAIETEKIRAVSGSPPSARSASGGVVPLVLPERKGSPWRAVAFATLGLVAISGGVLAYLFGTMPGHPLGDSALVAGRDPGAATRPVAEPLGDSDDPAKKPLTAPVIPVQPADREPTVVASAKPDGKAGASAASGTKLAAAPVREPGRSATGKGEPETGPKTPASTKVAAGKLPGTPQPGAGPAQTNPAAEAAPPRKSSPAAEVAVAAKTGTGASQSTKVAGSPAPTHNGAQASAPPPPKQTGVPVIAGKQQPKTWEVVALSEPGPKPPVQRSVTIAGSAPSPADSDAGSRGAHPPADRPAAAPREGDPASKPATGDPEALMRDAQAAFVRGDRQTAIATAMRVAARGGDEAIKAWRFVGAAACSGRAAALAANAYRNLHDPDHRRLLVELCQRNGLHFHDGNFSTEE